MIEAAELGFDVILKNGDDNEISYEDSRVSQALKAAGINPRMLNSMDMAALRAALTLDSNALEEGTALDIASGIGIFRDHLHLTQEEIDERNGKMPEMEEEPERGLSILGRNVLALFMGIRRRLFLQPVEEITPDMFDLIAIEEGALFQESARRHDMTQDISYALAREALGGMEGNMLSGIREVFGEKITASLPGCELPSRKKPMLDLPFFSAS